MRSAELLSALLEVLFHAGDDFVAVQPWIRHGRVTMLPPLWQRYVHGKHSKSFDLRRNYAAYGYGYCEQAGFAKCLDAS